MLKITGRRDSPRASVEIDPHVPFILRLGTRPEAGESLRWYCDEGDPSHFEIWMDRSGVIHRVALVFLKIPGRVTESNEPDRGPTIPTPGRVPVCDISAWDDPRIKEDDDQLTEQHRFDVHLGKDFASVRFHEAGEPREWIVNHKSRFGIDVAGRLCRVDLIGLSVDELSLMRKALTYEPKRD